MVVVVINFAVRLVHSTASGKRHTLGQYIRHRLYEDTDFVSV